MVKHKQNIRHDNDAKKKVPSGGFGSRLKLGFPLLIFFAAIALSLIGFTTASISINDLQERTFTRIIGGYKHIMTDKLFDYQALQLGSVGRIESALTYPLPENAWNRYIAVYEPTLNFPSMRFMAVSFGKTAKDNTISFIEPNNDMTKSYIDKTIETIGVPIEVAEKAANLDTTVASDPVNNQPMANIVSGTIGFYIITPIYDSPSIRNVRETLPKKLRGFSVSFIDSKSFFDNVFSQENLDNARTHVYIGDPKDKKTLYESDGIGTQNALSTRLVQNVPFYDKTLSVVYEFDKDKLLPWYTTYFPLLLLASGLLIGASFATASAHMIRRRYEALTYEKELDVALAKDELLSLASHQLRTPATGVKQYVGMVLQGFAGHITARQRDYLQRAYESNDRQLSVINDILHLAKLGSGRIVLAKHEFDIVGMVREVVEEHRGEVRKAKVKLSLAAPPSGVMVGDRHMLRMVIENLLSNAIKYTPPGGSIRVSVADQPDQWLVSVTDTGVGIAKADFPKIFEQFTRIKNPRTEFVTGTGVGLYLARNLTELHGGSIIVVSKPGVGSRFTISLPKKQTKD